jgi:hypothetical protein
MDLYLRKSWLHFHGRLPKIFHLTIAVDRTASRSTNRVESCFVRSIEYGARIHIHRRGYDQVWLARLKTEN